MKLEQKIFVHCLLFPILPGSGPVATGQAHLRAGIIFAIASDLVLRGINWQDNWHKWNIATNQLHMNAEI